ncbi:MAG: hypothetical protein K2F80_08490, partial [Muribaculaceae bacterium]|nr:hypothetical protein [Muribaculaceae bacterium]
MKLNTTSKKILSSVIISAMTGFGLQAQKVTAMIDSVTLEMGRTTAIHLEEIVPAGTSLILTARPETMLTPGVEIVTVTEPDTTDIGNNLLQIKRDLIIQSFDSGDYILPPIVYMRGTDSIKTDELALRVYPVDVSHMETINPDADIEKGDSRWWDFLPAFIVDYWEWILIFLVVVGTGLYAWLKLRKREIKNLFRAPEPKLSPYEVAVRDLSDLKSRNLCAGGMEKEYYTRLTDILRIYLQDRFGINAMEMTSSQIMRTLESRDEMKMSARLMRQILEIADFVKFAK